MIRLLRKNGKAKPLANSGLGVCKDAKSIGRGIKRIGSVVGENGVDVADRGTGQHNLLELAKEGQVKDSIPGGTLESKRSQ
jgi:hypothetical protein